MIPLAGKLGDDLRKKYGITQILPKNDTKKAILSECHSCKRFEQGPDLPNIGKISWCISRGFCKIMKRPYTDYRNIELMEICPKTVQKRQHR